MRARRFWPSSGAEHYRRRMGTPTPTTLNAIDAPWLTEALVASQAASADASISGFIRTDLGEGEGFVGDIARLELTYDRGAGPASVIAKVPTAVDLNRATGKSLGVYERDVGIRWRLSLDRRPERARAAQVINEVVVGVKGQGGCPRSYRRR